MESNRFLKVSFISIWASLPSVAIVSGLLKFESSKAVLHFIYHHFCFTFFDSFLFAVSFIAAHPK